MVVVLVMDRSCATHLPEAMTRQVMIRTFGHLGDWRHRLFAGSDVDGRDATALRSLLRRVEFATKGVLMPITTVSITSPR
jgi:hypothetical protein